MTPRLLSAVLAERVASIAYADASLARGYWAGRDNQTEFDKAVDAQRAAYAALLDAREFVDAEMPK